LYLFRFQPGDQTRFIVVTDTRLPCSKPGVYSQLPHNFISGTSFQLLWFNPIFGYIFKFPAAGVYLTGCLLSFMARITVNKNLAVTANQ
jgi:hypothetical protein